MKKNIEQLLNRCKKLSNSNDVREIEKVIDQLNNILDAGTDRRTAETIVRQIFALGPRLTEMKTETQLELLKEPLRPCPVYSCRGFRVSKEIRFEPF